ncbi:MAG: 16S rRNA (guanine(966)-N(2))-methyltransferase RsmD [Deltaproteobacteria bacterium]|nr:16S rRNA (guanine(966)-N(2))-methyltransferase RsmD [Deltaproteobacteria bacterium]
MRIISGTAKGRRLDVPKNDTVRPTTDRVREALFSSLGSKIQDAKILDLFAGSGSLGIESLSRNASHVTFIEKSKNTALLLKKNITGTGFEKESKVIICDAISYLKRVTETKSEKFDLIFLDPPYRTTLLQDCINMNNLIDIININGIIIAEHPSDTLPEINQNQQILRTKKYGNSTITTIGFIQ